MNRILIIARREYMEVLRTKTFWFSTFLPVLFMAIAVGVGVWHSGKPTAEQMAGIRAMFARSMGAFFYIFVMFMSTITPSQLLLTSLIEEKSSRVIEVLLSAVSPLELMAGKILGLFAVGLTIALVYVAALAAAAGGAGLLQTPDAVRLTLFIVYYLLGFAMYASLFAGVGAAFNTVKDAQTVMMPLSVLLVLPMVLWMNIIQHPTAAYSVALSIFPLTAPTIMILRITALPSLPWRDIAASLLLLAGSVPIVVWGAAKVFRTGVLIYGKPPTLREILRWVRNS